MKFRRISTPILIASILAVTAVVAGVFFVFNLVKIAGKVKAPVIPPPPEEAVVVINFGEVSSGDLIIGKGSGEFTISNVGELGLTARFTGSNAPQPLAGIAMNITIIKDTGEPVWKGCVVVLPTGNPIIFSSRWCIVMPEEPYIDTVEIGEAYKYPFKVTSGNYKVTVDAGAFTGYVESDTNFEYVLKIQFETPQIEVPSPSEV